MSNETKKVTKEDFNNALDTVMEYLRDNKIVCLLLDPEKKHIIAPASAGVPNDDTKNILGDKYMIDVLVEDEEVKKDNEN